MIHQQLDNRKNTIATLLPSKKKMTVKFYSIETYSELYEQLICLHQMTIAVIFDHRKGLSRKYWHTKYQPDTEE